MNSKITVDQSSLLFISDSNSNIMPAVGNLWLVTADEKGNITPLEYSEISRNIDSSIKNGFINNKGLEGKGSLCITSMNGAMQDISGKDDVTGAGETSAFNGSTIVFQGDHFKDWEGKTYVTTGTLALSGKMTFGKKFETTASTTASTPASTPDSTTDSTTNSTTNSNFSNKLDNMLEKEVALFPAIGDSIGNLANSLKNSINFGGDLPEIENQSKVSKSSITVYGQEYENFYFSKSIINSVLLTLPEEIKDLKDRGDEDNNKKIKELLGQESYGIGDFTIGQVKAAAADLNDTSTPISEDTSNLLKALKYTYTDMYGKQEIDMSEYVDIWKSLYDNQYNVIYGGALAFHRDNDGEVPSVVVNEFNMLDKSNGGATLWLDAGLKKKDSNGKLNIYEYTDRWGNVQRIEGNLEETDGGWKINTSKGNKGELFIPAEGDVKLISKNAGSVWDNTTERILGSITADTVTLGANTNVWYDKVSTVDTKTNMTFTITTNELNVSTYNKESKTYKNEKMKDGTLAGLFDRPLLKAEVAKSEDNGATTYTITVKTKSAKEYVEKEGKDWTAAEKEQMMYLDEQRLFYSSNHFDAIYNANNPRDVLTTLHNMARSNGYENVTMMTGHLGNPTSNFFGGFASMSGMTKRGQEEQEEAVSPQESSSSSYPQEDPNRWTAWAKYSHSSINVGGYEDDGIWKDSFDVRRTGILTGLSQQLSDTFSASLLFAYSGPELNQHGLYEGSASLGEGGYVSNIDMNDFQFALNFKKILARNWVLNTFVGGGAQSLDWKRTLYERNTGYSFSGDTTGNTLTATFYLMKYLQFTENFAVTPMIGFDTEHTWIYGFEEEGIGSTDNTNYYKSQQQCYHYDRVTSRRQTARIGASAAYTNPFQTAGLSVRGFYGRQLSNEDGAIVRMWEVGQVEESGKEVRGNRIGKDSLNVGIGGYLYLNTLKTLSLTGDYSAIFYDNATTQNVTAGLEWKF
ncbi:MAG: autotransporter outer membrane beta-barrel domain-containing protein [Thermoguttaceae bacterium]|nr:autotransporter outer membrane beta-barrel domain-containing protein [Thermoguttaceae bacterium]